VRLAANVVEREEGHLDVLVNMPASPVPCATFMSTPVEDVAAVLLTNVAGYVRVMHAFLPLLELSADPRIVNVSSGLGSFALFHDSSRIESRAGTPLYGAAKSAINMLTASLRATTSRYPQINSADPGMTATDLSGGQGHSVKRRHRRDHRVCYWRTRHSTGAYRDGDGDLPW